MIARAQIEKLGALHAVEPTMLSLYLAVPTPANLTARADVLIAAAEATCGRPLALRDRDRVLEKLPPCARDCTGRTVAVFACPARLRPTSPGGLKFRPTAWSPGTNAGGAAR